MFYNTLVPFTCAPCSRVPRLQSWRLNQIIKIEATLWNFCILILSMLSIAVHLKSQMQISV